MERHITRHHLIPKERAKQKTHKQDQSEMHLDTVLKLWRDKHDAWHYLFKNMTIDEIIICLMRVKVICMRKNAKGKKFLHPNPLNQSYFVKIQSE